MKKEKTLTGYPSVDKPWLKYYKKGSEKVVARDESMFQMLERCNRNRLDKIALELRTSDDNYEQSIQLTYREYIGKIKQAACVIKKVFDTQIDEIVPIIIPNLPESRILIYAFNIVGATVYPINPMLSVKTFEKILNDNHIKTIAIFSGFWNKYSNAIIESKVQNIIYLDGLESFPQTIKKNKRKELMTPKEDRIVFYDNIFRDSNTAEIEPYFRKNHIAVIIGTSGTTGTSKGVCLTDHNLNSMALGQMISDHYRTGDVALDILIQSIVYGVSQAHSLGCIGCHRYPN